MTRDQAIACVATAAGKLDASVDPQGAGSYLHRAKRQVAVLEALGVLKFEDKPHPFTVPVAETIEVVQDLDSGFTMTERGMAVHVQTIDAIKALRAKGYIVHRTFP